MLGVLAGWDLVAAGSDGGEGSVSVSAARRSVARHGVRGGGELQGSVRRGAAGFG